MSIKKILITLLGLFTIAMGVYSMVTPIETYMSIGYIVGVSMIFEAIGSMNLYFEYKKYTDITGWYLVNAILSLIFGIIIILSLATQVMVDIVIAYMVAVWIIMLGIFRINIAVKLKKIYNTVNIVGKNWWLALLLGILMILFGVLSLINPTALMVAIGILMGLIIIIIGISILTYASLW